MFAKKVVVFISFIFISVFFAGIFFIHAAFLISHKNEYKTLLFNNYSPNHKTIFINPSELYTNSKTIIWEDNNQEIFYKGVLYDIIHIQSNGTSVKLLVESDEIEMDLKNKFSSFFNDNYSKSTQKPFNILKSFFELKFLYNLQQYIIRNAEHFLILNREYLSVKTQSGFYLLVYSPPDFCM